MAETNPGVAATTILIGNEVDTVAMIPVAELAAVDEAQINPDLKNQFKVAISVVMISSGAIVGALSGLLENKKAHKGLVKAFSVLSYASLVLGIGLSVLTSTQPKITTLVKITKFTTWIAIVTTTYALACATALLLPKLVEVIIVLVVPSVVFCLIAALKWGG